jgi:hypothetical protein
MPPSAPSQHLAGINASHGLYNTSEFNTLASTEVKHVLGPYGPPAASVQGRMQAIHHPQRPQPLEEVVPDSQPQELTDDGLGGGLQSR